MGITTIYTFFDTSVMDDVCAMGQLGDLLLSSIKRDVGVKDMRLRSARARTGVRTGVMIDKSSPELLPGPFTFLRDADLVWPGGRYRGLAGI